MKGVRPHELSVHGAGYEVPELFHLVCEELDLGTKSVSCVAKGGFGVGVGCVVQVVGDHLQCEAQGLQLISQGVEFIFGGFSRLGAHVRVLLFLRGVVVSVLRWVVRRCVVDWWFNVW
jgi:hypothetical protein